MAWSPGNTKMYHMDSGLRKLWSFNFDDVSSCLTNRQVCWWTSTTRGWVSRTPCARTARGGCGGRGSLEPPLSWCDPAIGELLANIEFPAPHMMSCCFWGGGGRGRSPSHDIMLLQGSRLQWMFVTNTALKFHLLNETCLCRWPLASK